MKTIRLLLAAAAATAAAPVSAAAVITDASFENPVLANGTLVYNPTIAGATFNTGSGSAANGSAFGFAPAPDGRQVAFLQSYGNYVGSFSLLLTGLTPGASYILGFDAAQRAGYANNIFTVSFDGSSLGSFTAPTTDWTQLLTGSFVATGTTGTLTFTGSTTTGDNDVGIDALVLNPTPGAVPEPATWAMMLVGFGAIGLAFRHGRVARKRTLRTRA